MSTAKKKLTQAELRRLMNEQKKKLPTSLKKIDHPLAKYDKEDILHCIVCETVVKSENVWTVHLNSKGHKQNIFSKLKKKEADNNTFTAPLGAAPKRPAPVESSPSLPKKIKSILKNSYSKDQQREISSDTEPQLDSENVNDKINDLEEFSIKNNDTNTIIEDSVSHSELNVAALPEGFFDDPKLDAKARNVEYRDPIEEEWERFQKEIKEETNKAQQIIADDQEESTTERQLDEIDEQIRNWSRVLTLEKQKERVNTIVGSQIVDKLKEELSDDGEFEEFFDWRSKKSFEKKLNSDKNIKSEKW